MIWWIAGAIAVYVAWTEYRLYRLRRTAWLLHNAVKLMDEALDQHGIYP